MAKKKKEFTKVKKKKWVEILAPERYHKQVMGESYVEEATNLMGRQIKVNLMTLTRDIKKQNINAVFQVKDIKENKAWTKLIGFNIIPAAVRRLIRRRRNKIENSFVLTSKDGIEFRIKPIIITQNKIPKSTSTDLRKFAKAELEKAASEMEFDAFLSLILINKMQKEIKNKLHKIVPIRIVEIRYAKVIVKRK